MLVCKFQGLALAVPAELQRRPFPDALAEQWTRGLSGTNLARPALQNCGNTAARRELPQASAGGAPRCGLLAGVGKKSVWRSDARRELEPLLMRMMMNRMERELHQIFRCIPTTWRSAGIPHALGLG